MPSLPNTVSHHLDSDRICLDLVGLGVLDPNGLPVGRPPTGLILARKSPAAIRCSSVEKYDCCRYQRPLAFQKV
jgi:hypothetical protein